MGEAWRLLPSLALKVRADLDPVTTASVSTLGFGASVVKHADATRRGMVQFGSTLGS